MRYLEMRITYLLNKADAMEEKVGDMLDAPIEVYQKWQSLIHLVAELCIVRNKIISQI